MFPNEILANICVEEGELKLDLFNKNLTHEDVPAIIGFLKTRPDIQSLSLFRNHIGAKGARLLVEESTTITDLDVRQNNIEDEGVKALAENKTIKSLDVRYNDSGLEGVLALAENTTLTSLKVGRAIDDKGIEALAKNKTLKSLDVRENDFGDNGALALAENTTLTYLNVSGNKGISVRGIKALASCINLELLEFETKKWDQERIGRKGIEALREVDPLKRANHGREVGIKTDVPALLRLCLFKIKSSEVLKTKGTMLSEDIIKKLQKPKV